MTVYLVGAGPGHPGLITVRGAELLSRAEVIVLDRLAEPSLIDLAPEGVELIDVGKRPGGGTTQEEINEILIERGRRGTEVVRLKGGDPFVFGRGGEEALALMNAGVDFEVVPGVSAAVAVPAFAGIPVTHRGLSAAFTVVTGHPHRAIEADVDLEALARLGGTIVVLMGVARRGEIAQRLMDAGMPGATPVVAVRWGTRPDQQVLRTNLAELGSARVEAPSTLVIGAVARLDLRSVGSHPIAPRGTTSARALAGWRVGVTRASLQASTLSDRLAAAGAEPVEVALVRIDPPPDGGKALSGLAARAASYDWVVFTSANAVNCFVAHLRDGRSFGSAKVAAVGPGTAGALATFGIQADLVPGRFVAEGLLDVFPFPDSIRSGEGDGATPATGDTKPGPPRLLLPSSTQARTELADGLRSRGYEVDVVAAYQPVALVPSPDELRPLMNCSAIVFTSASGVNALADALDSAGLTWGAGRGAGPRAVCIGPVTGQAARERGIPVAGVAGVHTLDGLVDELARLRKLSG
ncbi:MAG: uroporphyrinogen-III C-methyltransferase [Acidimicrobiales bacterium]